MRALSLLLCCVLVLMAPGRAVAEDFLVVLDLSGSMGDQSDMEPAKEGLRQAMIAVQTPGARWGMRVYGSGCCEPDTELVIPLSTAGRKEIETILPRLEGISGSPMPAALASAREGELEQSNALFQSVLLVSDGVVDREAACREARLLREDGVRVTVIGIESTFGSGASTLRYIAESPDCAAGTYIGVEEPNKVALAIQRAAQAAFGFPYRLIALVLSIVASFYLTSFLEHVFERSTNMRKERVPRVCNALYLLLVLASAALFLGSATPGIVTVVLVILALILAGTYLALTFLKDAVT